MKKLWSVLLLGALLLSLTACGPAKNKVELTIGQRDTGSRTYTYFGQEVEREYYYYIPSTYTPGTKMPLMLALHGSASNALSQLYESDMEKLAEKEGFIVIAPNSVAIHADGTLSSKGYTLSTIGRSDMSYLRWNATPDDPQNIYEVDDVQYLCDLIDQFVDYGYVDAKRVYCSGLSHGAFMSIRMAVEASDKIAGIGSVAGLLPGKFTELTPSQVKLVFVHGTADPVVPIYGLTYGDYRYALPLENTVDWFLKTYGVENYTVESSKVEDTNTTDGCTIDRYAYVSSDGSTPIVKYIVNNGGHTWPGGTQYSPAYYIGNLCKDAQASELIWNELKDASK